MLLRLIISIHWLPTQAISFVWGTRRLFVTFHPRRPAPPHGQHAPLAAGQALMQGHAWRPDRPGLPPAHPRAARAAEARREGLVEACHPQHALSLIGAHQSIQRTVHAHQQQGQPSNSLTVGMQHHQSRSPLGAASIKVAHL